MSKFIGISQVSKLLNLIHPATKKPLNHILRYWEKEFKEIQPKKKSSGTRKYTPEMVRTLQFIHHLVKEKGMTLEGAKKQLHLQAAGDSKKEVLAKLEHIKATLLQLKEKM